VGIPAQPGQAAGVGSGVALPPLMNVTLQRTVWHTGDEGGVFTKEELIASSGIHPHLV